MPAPKTGPAASVCSEFTILFLTFLSILSVPVRTAHILPPRELTAMNVMNEAESFALGNGVPSIGLLILNTGSHLVGEGMSINASLLVLRSSCDFRQNFNHQNHSTKQWHAESP